MGILLAASVAAWLALFSADFAMYFIRTRIALNNFFRLPPSQRLTMALEPLAKKANLSSIHCLVTDQRFALAHSTCDFQKSRGVIIFAEEFLNLLLEPELQCVLAHELSHIWHKHPMRLSIANSAAMAFTIDAVFLGWMGIMYSFFTLKIPIIAAFPVITAGGLMFFALFWFFSTAICVAYERHCEYSADRMVVSYFGCDPEVFASALQKGRGADIADQERRILGLNFRSHPTLKKRIAALRALKR